MSERQRFQGLAELALHDRIEEANALHFCQLERPHAIGAPQIEAFDIDNVLADSDLLVLDADNAARQGSGLRGVRLLQRDLDLLASGLVENVTEGWIVRQVDGERLQ